MKKKREPKISTFIKRITNTQNEKNIKADPNILRKNIRILPRKILYNKKELNSIRELFFVPNELGRKENQKINIDQHMNDHFNDIYQKIVDNKINYEKITKLEPKIEQAEMIIIPSILSPNSFKNNSISFKFSDEITPEMIEESTKAEILSVINNYANVDLKLNDKLREWIRESLFIYGSKPIMIFPSSIITAIRNQSISFEEFIDTIDNRTPIISNDLSKFSIDMNSIHTISDEISDDIFKIVSTEILDELNYDNGDLKSLLNDISSRMINEMVSITTEDLKTNRIIDITDKLEYLGNSISKNSFTTKKIIDIYNKYYGIKQEDGDKDSYKNLSISFVKSSGINIVNYLNENDEEKHHPILIELPPESVIPLFIPSDPSNHIGYFVFLDEEGYPISDNEIPERRELDNRLINSFDQLTTNNDLIDNVFNSSSYYGKNIKSISKSLFKEHDIKANLMKKTYNLILDQIINNTIKSAGFINVNYKLKNTLLTNMFYRLMKHKKTKILFVPSFMMTYLAFKYDSNGIGVSKIEELAFPLSLKITFLVTTIFRLINQAIEKKEVKVSLSDNVSNPVSLLYKIKSMLMMNKGVDLTYDPVQIIKSLAERQYSFVIDNIPGINQFSIEQSTNQQANIPEDSINEIIDKLITTILEVPPSAYNELSENEYSRSLTTINMLFSLRMNFRRKIVIEKISEMMRNYLYFDKDIQNKIYSILRNRLSKSKLKDKDINDLIKLLIKNLVLFIPEPRIVFDKSEFEHANEYIDFIESLIEKMYPSELINDRDNQDTLKNITSYIKYKLIKHFLSETDLVIGSDKLFDDLEEIDLMDMIEIEEFVSNYKKAISTYYSKIKKSNDQGSSSF